MCARHSLRNCCWAADPYTLPIAAPRLSVFCPRAASAFLVFAEAGPVVIAVCTTLAVRSTCSTSNWSRPAYSCAATVVVDALDGLEEAMCEGDLLEPACEPPVLEQAAVATAATAATTPARTIRELRMMHLFSRSGETLLWGVRRSARCGSDAGADLLVGETWPSPTGLVGWRG